jgi:ParB family protein of integrating conjugative element (PFGI_1 class)
MEAIMSDRVDPHLTDKLLADGFARTGPVATALSDPIADTPMLLNLDQLAAYELDPRLTRNPKYDEIKASIRERGLDSPPTVTRRHGHEKYIIRNGGNTRLAILRELWSETKDERFYRIACLFKPWRNEITALTGHLSENELRGGLTFIERALGVEKARELYEQEGGKPLSQSELARRLAADGFPVPQPHISRMQEAVAYLLPAIPTALYGGLGRPQIEKLTALRNAAQRLWDQRSGGLPLADDFPSLFHEVLSGFDAPSGSFSIQRVLDELVGRMAETFDADYDTLALALSDVTHLQELISAHPTSVQSSSLESASAREMTAVSSSSAKDAQSDIHAQGAVRAPPAPSASKAAEFSPLQQTVESGPTSSGPEIVTVKQQGTQSDHLHGERLQSFQLANRLAGVFGMSDAVVQVSTGAGFAIGSESTSIGGPTATGAMLRLLACLGEEASGTPHFAAINVQPEGRLLARLFLNAEMDGSAMHLGDADLNGLFDLIWLLREFRSQQASPELRLTNSPN